MNSASYHQWLPFLLFSILQCSENKTGPNLRPLAIAGFEQHIRLGEGVMLDASASFDPDQDPLQYDWQIVSKPLGALAELSSKHGVQTFLKPDRRGLWRVQLLVSDGEFFSWPDLVSLEVIGCVGDTYCDDRIRCTEDRCQNGTCTYFPSDALCDDANSCTQDTCDPAYGCFYQATREGEPCHVNLCQGICQAGICVGCGCSEDIDCDDGIACTVDRCVSGSCQFIPDDSQCADALYCNGNEVCLPGVGCRAGTAVPCYDGIDCTTDECREDTRSCVFVADDAFCDNGDICDGIETCSLFLGCQIGTPLVCPDDGLICNGTTACHPEEGCLSSDAPLDGTPCDEGLGKDGNFCNSSCRGGICISIFAPDGQVCDDGDFCTMDDRCLGGVCFSGLPLDADGDGYVDENCPGGDDCDDSNPNINPGAREDWRLDLVCQDNLDNDCDGFVDMQDEGCQNGWWALDFAFRQKISFQNASGDETLLDFPILVLLRDWFDFENVSVSGQDIRFVDQDGLNVLDFEIEHFDKDLKIGVFWVRVPQIEKQSDSDYIWMYYGNASALPADSPASVWNSHFKAVWHLGENVPPGGSSGIHLDSTSNQNHGTQNKNGVAVDGAIGFGQWFDASLGCSIRIPQAGFSNIEEAITIEAWAFPINPPSSIDFAHVLGAGDNGRHWQLWLNRESFRWSGRLRTNDQDFYIIANHSSQNQQWHYLVLQYNGQTIELWVNGQRVAQENQSGSLLTINSEIWIGANPVLPGREFRGFIDEVRISSVAFGQAWIQAQYRSMSGDFLSWGAVEFRDVP